MPLQKYVRFIVLQLVLLAFATCSHAQTDTDTPQNHERVYQVELIVFSRPEINPQEAWPTDVKLSYPDNLVSLKTDNSSEGFSLLPASERTLNAQAATLARSGTYSVLYHQAWRQTIYARKTHIFISGGKNVGGHQELEGSIALSVGQYLKIQTNLWLSQFAPAGTNLTESWPSLPPLPFAEATTSDKSQDYLIKRIVKVSQERSMRSNEVHYIDHPLLGIVVKIIPYDTAGKIN
ncbi:CsiV family protein [Cellvibrio sp.]|uniref:CsiV family protein n=1 Tax=Cellvibrio sp. TaxID=1965322 RepID=UPI0039647869